MRADTTTDKDGRFSARFPAEVSRGSAVMDTGSDKVTIHSVSTIVGPRMYTVAYFDDPSGAEVGSDDDALQAMAQGAAQNANGRIHSQRACKAGDVKGLDVIFDVPGGGAMRMRFYAPHSRVFEVQYVGPAGSEGGDEALAFLGSFRLL